MKGAVQKPFNMREPRRTPVVASPNASLLETPMLELAAMVAVSAVAVTFVTDATSGTLKMVRALRNRGQIRVASDKQMGH
jgi:hypothetical protein